jgi:hypothetical protein
VRKWLITAASVLVAIALLFWAENSISHSFQHCASHEAAEQSTSNANKSRFIVGRFIRRQIVCSVHLVDRHNGLIAALAGLIVAAFTATLWWSTRELQRTTKEHAAHLESAANAAALQAKTAVGIAIPTVFVSDIKLLGNDHDHVLLGSSLKPPKVEVTYRNYGQTPAFLVHESVNIVHMKELGDGWADPTYWSIKEYPPGSVIEQNKEMAKAHDPYGPGWGDDTANDIWTGNQYLWVYGFLCFHDFMSNFYGMGFCARWGIYPDGSSFRFGYGPVKYTYARQRKEPPSRSNPNLPPFAEPTKES